MEIRESLGSVAPLIVWLPLAVAFRGILTCMKSTGVLLV